MQRKLCSISYPQRRVDIHIPLTVPSAAPQGQSNMQLSIAMALNASAEIAALPLYGSTVRVFYAQGNPQTAPQTDLPRPAMAWARMGPAAGAANWGGFSATCWYTGRALWAALGGGAVPVGLVESAVGGTAVRNWVPTEALAMCPQPYNCEQHRTRAQTSVMNYPSRARGNGFLCAHFPHPATLSTPPPTPFFQPQSRTAPPLTSIRRCTMG